MKIFIWEIIDLDKFAVRQGSVCSDSKKKAYNYIEQSLTPDEKELFVNCEIKVKELKLVTTKDDCLFSTGKIK